MRLICILAVFLLPCIPVLSLSVHASPPKIYRLGVPKDHNAPPYKWLLTGLEKKGLVVGENLQIIPIDISNYQVESDREKIRQEIAQKCDLFFTTGTGMQILYKVEPRSPLLFLNVAGAERAVPKTMQANTTGIRIGSESGIFKQMVELLPLNQRQKIGLILCEKSRIALMTPGFLQTCAQLNIQLVIKKYAHQDGIAPIMQEFKAEKVGCVVLFPPAQCNQDEIQELISQQNNLKLPIIGLVRADVEQGLFGGTTINDKVVKLNLADYATKILQGRSPSQLPVKYFSPKYVVNLATASRLGLEIPPEVINQAEIVGLARFSAEVKAATNKPLVPGNYVLGLTKIAENSTVQTLLRELEKRGYVEGKNLQLQKFNIDFEDSPPKKRKMAAFLAAHTDVIFITGNVLQSLASLADLNTPVCFIATKETAAIIPAAIKSHFTGVIRTSFGSSIKTAQEIVPGTTKLAMLGRVGLKLPKAIKRYRKVANDYGVTLNYKMFANKNEIGPLMRELQEGYDAMLLFSPGIDKDHLAEIVHWQNQLGFPVLAHLEKGVQAGLLAGMVVDIDKVMPQVAEYIDKLFQGRAASQLPYYYYYGKMVINLRTASKLGRDIPVAITSQAEIIH